MIDLSNNNAKSWLPLAYNFHKVVDAGHRRIYFKATEGATYKDKRTPKLAAKARKAGMKVGWYHFANSWWESPQKQANFFLKSIPAEGWDCIPCLDMEQGSPSAAKGTWAMAFIHEVERQTGVPCMVYGSAWYLQTCFQKKNIGDSPLWIAAYTRSYTIPKPWTPNKVAFWQFTSTASVPGVPGRCDVSKPIHPALADVPN